MRESCTYGSVRGARGNSRPYRNASYVRNGHIPDETNATGTSAAGGSRRAPDTVRSEGAECVYRLRQAGAAIAAGTPTRCVPRRGVCVATRAGTQVGGWNQVPSDPVLVIRKRDREK